MTNRNIYNCQANILNKVHTSKIPLQQIDFLLDKFDWGIHLCDKCENVHNFFWVGQIERNCCRTFARTSRKDSSFLYLTLFAVDVIMKVELMIAESLRCANLTSFSVQNRWHSWKGGSVLINNVYLLVLDVVNQKRHVLVRSSHVEITFRYVTIQRIWSVTKSDLLRNNYETVACINIC